MSHVRLLHRWRRRHSFSAACQAQRNQHKLCKKKLKEIEGLQADVMGGNGLTVHSAEVTAWSQLQPLSSICSDTLQEMIGPRSRMSRDERSARLSSPRVKTDQMQRCWQATACTRDESIIEERYRVRLERWIVVLVQPSRLLLLACWRPVESSTVFSVSRVLEGCAFGELLFASTPKACAKVSVILMPLGANCPGHGPTRPTVGTVKVEEI